MNKLLIQILSKIEAYQGAPDELKKKFEIELTNSLLGALSLTVIQVLFLNMQLWTMSLILFLPTLILYINVYLSTQAKFLDLPPILGATAVATSIFGVKWLYPSIHLESAFFFVLAVLFITPAKYSLIKISRIITLILYSLTLILEVQYQYLQQTEGFAVSNLVYLSIQITCMIVLHIILNHFFKLQRHYEKRILSLEKEEHERELKLKKRDLELLEIANTYNFDKNEQLVKEVKTILMDEKSHHKSLKSLYLKLKNQLNHERRTKEQQANLELVNSAFYDRLTKEYPALTKSELAMCAYLKLNLSAKEIASIRQTSVNAVNVSKNRVRKKMDLESNFHLDRLIQLY